MRIDRLNSISDYVAKKGTATLEELADEFGVSMNTIRRDVHTLVENNKVEKVYGGVTAMNQLYSDKVVPIATRAAKNVDAKQAIGYLASTLVKDNSSIFVDSGSTTPKIVSHLANRTGITLITSSLTVLIEASRYPNLNVVSPGGIYYNHTDSFLGMNAIDALSRMTVDTIFIAATGVSIESGLTNTTYLEAEIKRHIVKRGRKVVLMADHSKFGYSSILTFCNFKDIDCIVTDRMPEESYLKVMEEHHIKLMIAEQ